PSTDFDFHGTVGSLLTVEELRIYAALWLTRMGRVVSPPPLPQNRADSLGEASSRRDTPRKFLKLLRREELHHSRQRELSRQRDGDADESTRWVTFGEIEVQMTSGMLQPRASSMALVRASLDQATTHGDSSGAPPRASILPSLSLSLVYIRHAAAGLQFYEYPANDRSSIK
ncbi:hypothetical protein CYMTET_27517, partial [Cymbomonas tetramitiformis]